jgi:hypothetical protein
MRVGIAGVDEEAGPFAHNDRPLMGKATIRNAGGRGSEEGKQTPRGNRAKSFGDDVLSRANPLASPGGVEALRLQQLDGYRGCAAPGDRGGGVEGVCMYVCLCVCVGGGGGEELVGPRCRVSLESMRANPPPAIVCRGFTACDVQGSSQVAVWWRAVRQPVVSVSPSPSPPAVGPPCLSKRRRRRRVRGPGAAAVGCAVRVDKLSSTR